MSFNTANKKAAYKPNSYTLSIAWQLIALSFLTEQAISTSQLDRWARQRGREKNNNKKKDQEESALFESTATATLQSLQQSNYTSAAASLSAANADT